MFNTLGNELYFSQKIKLKVKFSNRELLLLDYFKNKTRIFPENVIMLNDFIFYFVKNTDYFRAKMFQHSLRKDFCEKKIMIISIENILIKQIFNFFPDTYIHDLILEPNEKDGGEIITVYFLSYEERGIAVGRGGDYIKAINEIFQKYVTFESYFKKKVKIKIQCELINF